MIQTHQQAIEQIRLGALSQIRTLGLSNKEIARRSLAAHGVGTSTVLQWLNGRVTNPTLATYLAVTTVINQAVEDISPAPED